MINGDDRFAVLYELDATNRKSGERSVMREIGVYYIEEGKVVREEFFFAG